jgi:hypothetical protein
MADGRNLFRLINEVVFTLVGALLVWVGLFGQYLFNPRRPAWLALTVVLMLWGARTLSRAPRIAVPRERLVIIVGGASLVLAGTILLYLSWAPFRWAGPLLAASGAVFILRGLITAALLAKPF